MARYAIVRHLGKTNVLTEIPQDIKLELADGVLTLKAGSKVYVPNGFEADGVTPKFDVVVIESDLSVANVSSTESGFVFYAPSTKVFGYYRTVSYSGDTAPTNTSSHVWYDTSNNIVKIYSGANDEYFNFNSSLPLGLISSTSIDQVFNGLGYIGSTVFALPGVKGLIPDGWNNNDTMKNIEFAINNVITRDFSDVSKATQILGLSDTSIARSSTSSFRYDKKNNLNLSGTYTWTACFVGEIQIENNKVSSLTLKKVGEGVVRNKLYVPVKRRRDYYKYGTEPNATVVGSPTINNGVVSGFSTSKYLKFPTAFQPSTNTWEMVFKITTGSNITTAQYIMALGKGFTEATRYATRIGIHENKNFVISVSYNGTAWDIVGGSTAGAKGSHTVLPNTTYYLKYEFTGGAYKLSYSLDGVDYIQDCYVESTTPMYNSNTANLIGVWNNSSYINPFLGSIDLTQSYININGKRWWHGTKAYKLDVDDGDKYEDWVQPVLTANGVLGENKFACTASDYITNYPPYCALDSDSSTQWRGNAATSAFTIYNPTPIKVSKLSLVQFTGSTYKYWSTSGNVYGSNDNSSWTLLTSYTNNVKDFVIDLSTNEQAFKYYKIQSTTSTYKFGLTSLTITAQELKVVGGTVEDADYYVDRNVSYNIMLKR